MGCDMNHDIIDLDQCSIRPAAGFGLALTLPRLCRPDSALAENRASHPLSLGDRHYVSISDWHHTCLLPLPRSRCMSAEALPRAAEMNARNSPRIRRRNLNHGIVSLSSPHHCKVTVSKPGKVGPWQPDRDSDSPVWNDLWFHSPNYESLFTS